MAGFTGELLSIERFYDPINDGGNYTVALRCAVAWFAAHGLGSRSGFEWPPGPPVAPGALSGDGSSGFVPPTTSAGLGGVIYFPPKSDGSGYSIGNPPDASPSYAAIGTPSTCNATVVVPGGITLMFAPGAYLQIQSGHVITIGGAIEAGLQQIFAVVDDSYVVFNGNEIKEVYPEWWGVGSGGPTGDTVALQAAINASFNFRYFYDGVGQANNLPAIPLRLSGKYTVSSTLTLGKLPADPFILTSYANATPPPGVPQGQSNQNPFQIVGNAGSQSWPLETATITALPTFQPGMYRPDRNGTIMGPTAPMMVSNFSNGFSIEHISFDGGGKADGCLVVQGIVFGGNASVTAHNNQVVHCSFRGATRYLLQIGPDAVTTLGSVTYNDGSAEQQDVQTVTDPQYSPGGDYLEFSVDRCDFFLDQAALAGGTYGIILRASPSLPITIRNCAFRGTAEAMIRLFTCTLLLENCVFANSWIPRSSSVDPATGMRLPDGSDVYIDLDPPYIPPGTPRSFTYTGNVYVGLTAINCQSRSVQFLGTFPPDSGLRRAITNSTLYVYNVVIIGLLHYSYDSSVPSRPAIDWQFPRNFSEPDPNSAGLVLIGCLVNGQVVIGNQADVGPVTAIGTTTRPDAGASPFSGAADIVVYGPTP